MHFKTRFEYSLTFIFIILFSSIAGSFEYTGQADGFQRGDRIVPQHMNDIDTALDTLESDVSVLQSGGGDVVLIEGVGISDPSGVDMIGGNGLNITLDAGVSPDTATFTAFLTGTFDGTGSVSAFSGLEFTADTGLALIQGCANTEVLQWNDGASTWDCAAGGGGATTAEVNSSGDLAAINFNSTTPAAAGGTINIPLARSGADVAVNLTLSSITDVGQLTSALKLGADGLEFTGEAIDTNCSAQFPNNGGHGIFFNGTTFRKCEGGTESALSGAASTPLSGNAVGDIDMATHKLTGDYQCISEEVTSISTDEVYACMATPTDGGNFGSVLKIMVTPDRPDATDPALGTLLELAFNACLDSTDELGVDNSSGAPIGCHIEVAKGKYLETTSRLFNVDAAANLGYPYSGITIDLSGSEIRSDIPAPSHTGETFGTLTPTCTGLVDFGNFAIITDAQSNDHIGGGGGGETVPVFCNGDDWEIGHAMWTFGGPSSVDWVSGLTIQMPTFVSDFALQGDGREEHGRSLVLSADVGDSPFVGGIRTTILNGGRIIGSQGAALGSVGLDIGGGVGGFGGDPSGNRCSNITVNGLAVDGVEDSSPAVRVRNCSSVTFNNLQLANGGTIRIGEDVANETYPRGTIINGLEAYNCEVGPCLQLVSGSLDLRGAVFTGEDAGDIARIGGAVAPGVHLISDGANWISPATTNSQIFVGNVKSWFQRGGEIALGTSRTSADPMFIADNGADIVSITIDGVNEQNVSGDRGAVYKLTPLTQAEVTAGSYRDTSFASNAEVCFNEECEAGYDKVLVLDDPTTASQRWAEFLAPYMTNARGTQTSSTGIPEQMAKVKIIYDLVGDNRLIPERDCYNGDVDRDDIAGTNGSTYVADWPYTVCFGFHPVRSPSNWTLGAYKGWPDASGVLDQNAPSSSSGQTDGEQVQITHIGRIEIDQDLNDDGLLAAGQKDTAIFEWGNNWMAGNINKANNGGNPQCIDNFNATAVGTGTGVEWFVDNQDTARYPWDNDGTLSAGLLAYPDGHCDNVFAVRIHGVRPQGFSYSHHNFGHITIYNVDPLSVDNNNVAFTGEGIQSNSSTERFSTSSDSTVVYWVSNGSTYSMDHSIQIDLKTKDDHDDIGFWTANSFGGSPPRINMISENDGTGAMMYGAGNWARPAEWNLRNLDHTMVFGDPENGTEIPGWQLRCTDSFDTPVRTSASNPDTDANQTTGTPDGYCDDPSQVAVGPGRPASTIWPTRCPAMEYQSGIGDGQLDEVAGSKKGACGWAATPPRGYLVGSGMGEGPKFGGVTLAGAGHRLHIGGYYESGNNPAAKQISLMPYFCDGTSGTGTVRPRGTIASDPALCASGLNGSAMNLESDADSLWGKGQTPPGSQRIGYNNNNAGKPYATGAQGGISFDLQNFPGHISSVTDVFADQGWNFLVGAGCGFLTTVTVGRSISGGMNQDSDGNEFWVVPELLAGVGGCQFITSMRPQDGSLPVFAHGTLTTTTDDDFTKVYSKWGTNHTLLENARDEVFVQASLDGTNFNRTLEASDIQHAIDLACRKRGNRQEKCADVILPAGDYNLGTIYLTGTGVEPLGGTTGEGITGLTFRGAGGVSKDGQTGAGANWVQNSQCATTLRYGLNGQNSQTATNPMIWVHGGRDVTIADMCIVLDGSGIGSGGSPAIDTNIGVLVTADDSNGEESYGVHLENVNITGYSRNYLSDQTLTNTCVVSAPFGEDYQDMAALDATSWAGSSTINNLTISDSYLGCDYGWVGGAGISESNLIENTVIEYGITGVWPEDSDVHITGGRSYTHASLPMADTYESAICTNTSEWMKIDEFTKSISVDGHTVTAECGIAITGGHPATSPYLPIDMTNVTLKVGGETSAANVADTQDDAIFLSELFGHFNFSGFVEILNSEDFNFGLRTTSGLGNTMLVDLGNSNLYDWEGSFGGGTNVGISSPGIYPVGGTFNSSWDPRMNIQNPLAGAWNDDPFGFQKPVVIGTAVDSNSWDSPTDGILGISHSSNASVVAATFTNTMVGVNMYSTACTGGAFSEDCGFGISLLQGGIGGSQVERLSMHAATNTVIDMTDGATGTDGDVLINNGGVVVDYDLVVGDGAGTLTGTVEIGGEIDQPQLVIEGHSGQTDSVLVVQNDADAQVFNVNNNGTVLASALGDIATTSLWSIDTLGLITGSELDIVDDVPRVEFDDTDETFHADDRDGFISVNCNSFITQGCTMSFGVDNLSESPEMEIIEDGPNHQIEFNVPIVGNNVSMQLGTGTIQAGVETATVGNDATFAGATGQWVFATAGLTITLPTAIAGRSLCLYSTVAAPISLKAGPNDFISLSGTDLDDGDKITSPGAASNFACVLVANPTSLKETWFVLGQAGAWSDTGP